MRHTFSFEIDTKDMKHIDEVSTYDHNYYWLDLTSYGDYFYAAQCDVLYEEYDEFSDTYTYSLGFFDSTTPLRGEFVRCFTWLEESCKTGEY